MSEDVVKNCYNCGENIEKIYNDSTLCPGCFHPIKPKNDKLGFYTYAEDYIIKKAKSKAFSKTYNFAKNFFLSKLASYFLVFSVVLSGITTVNNVITENKNKQFIEKPENIIESGTINYFEIPVQVNIVEANSSNTNVISESINQNSEQIIEEQKNDDIIENIQEDNEEEMPILYSNNKWENFMHNLFLYCNNEKYDPSLFENEEVNGAVINGMRSNPGADIGTIQINSNGHIYVYYYYDDGDYSSNDGDEIFGRLELIEKEKTYSIVSDESTTISFEGIFDE